MDTQYATVPAKFMMAPGLVGFRMPEADAADHTSRECPLCGVVVPGAADDMNRHFGTDCTWRGTDQSPGDRAAAKGRVKA